jgi:uncharacterized membrane protein YphA (DoxX/SURF4 family)
LSILKRAKENWVRFEEWMFGWGSVHTMALYRILFGGLMLTNFLMLSVSYEDWFTDKGFFPAEFQHGAGSEDWPRINLLLWFPGETSTLIVFWGTVAAALFTMLGLGTRVATAALFIGMVTLHCRNWGILHSGDSLARVCAFSLMLAPAGRAYSLDRWLQVKRGDNSPPKLMSMWPQRVLAIQLAVVYFMTFWQKMQGSYWLDGTATYISGSLREFEKFPVPEFVMQQPMVAINTYYTLAIELALGVLIFFKPLRKWLLIGGLLLHAGIEYSMNIPLFAFIITAVYVVYYEGEETKAWVDRMIMRFTKRANPEETGASAA